MRHLRPLLGALGLIALWYLAVWAKIVDPALLPAPHAAAIALWNGMQGGKLYFDFLTTVRRTAYAVRSSGESLPQTFVGLRSGVALALVIVIVAEMFIGLTDGLGQRVFEAQQLFEMPDMYAAIFHAGALGYGLNLLFLLIEKRFVHWTGK